MAQQGCSANDDDVDNLEEIRSLKGYGFCLSALLLVLRWK
jgi:hypothetical protein